MGDFGDHPLKIKSAVRCSRTNRRSQSKTPECRSPGVLPPINGDGYLSPVRHTPFLSHISASSERLWSKYHQGCVEKSSAYLDWSAIRVQKEKVPGNGKSRSQSRTRLLKEDELVIADYLETHRSFLEAYVTEHVSVKDLEKWLQQKIKPKPIPAESPQILNKNKSKTTMRQTFIDLMQSLRTEPSEHQLIKEIARCLTCSVGVDAYRIYKLLAGHPDVVHYFFVNRNVASGEPQMELVKAGPNEVSLVLEVARKSTPLRLSRDNGGRFPEIPHYLFNTSKSNHFKNANHVMYQPLLTSEGETGYIIEMWRIKDQFRTIDEEVSANFMVWGSLAMHYSNLYVEKIRERNMSDFLLDVVKAIFEEMVSLDHLIKRILEFAQRLVNADRASLFLVDYRNFELVSTVFDLKFERGQDRDLEKKEIRMPINRGIAGHVALSGETMNIPDAYSDYRFNRDVDEATGYKTISILCMPIKVEGKVIGVVQMVNKRNDDNFGHEDEVAFEIFSTFFGLALHHARLYDRIMRKEQKYRVALEVLSYHNTCRENEVQALLSDKEHIKINLKDFYLDPYEYNEFEKCKYVLTMFDDLFDISTFDVMTVTRFVLTVKKNYRTVPYHNFDHGWSVAHTMYVILKNDTRKRFDFKTRLSLFVACLCHDLDHRGYTNKYMSETASPLAAMYTTSTLEHHHFNITVTILQQDGHNIFSHMSSEEYKEILGFIRHAILATDLAAFFPNLEKIKDLHKEDTAVHFDWAVTSHRELAMAISMTAADLSASAKPWEVQIKTVKVIFEEFYDQGDKEAAAGRTPFPMMDRNKPHEQPASQVGFLSQICVPCYTMLYKILPNTRPMYKMAMKNLRRWQYRADKVKQERELNSSIKTDDDFEDSDSEQDIHDDVSVETESEIVKDVKIEAVQSIVSNLASDDSPRPESIETFQEINGDCWEDDSGVDENRLSKEFWKNIEETSWVDDEGVIVKRKQQ